MKFSAWLLSVIVVLIAVSTVASSFKKDKITRRFLYVVSDISWAIYCSMIAWFMDSGFLRILMIFIVIGFLIFAFLDLRQYINLRASQPRDPIK